MPPTATGGTTSRPSSSAARRTAPGATGRAHEIGHRPTEHGAHPLRVDGQVWPRRTATHPGRRSLKPATPGATAAKASLPPATRRPRPAGARPRPGRAPIVRATTETGRAPPGQGASVTTGTRDAWWSSVARAAASPRRRLLVAKQVRHLRGRDAPVSLRAEERGRKRRRPGSRTLTPAPALAGADEQRAAARVEVALGQRERLLNAKAAAPKHGDQGAHRLSVPAGACPDCGKRERAELPADVAVRRERAERLLRLRPTRPTRTPGIPIRGCAPGSTGGSTGAPRRTTISSSAITW